MNKYTITAPEGFEAIETTVDGVTNISFIPKVVERKLPTTLEETIPFMPNELYWLDEEGDIMNNSKDKIFNDSLEDPNMLTSKEYAEAFLALMQLVRFRDIWNEGWIADWEDSNSQKYAICFDHNIVTGSFFYCTSHVLVFKTAELRDKFLETFRNLIETAKPLL